MKRLYKFLINRLPRPLLIRLSYVFRWFAPLLYKGNNVTCPVCGNSYRKFLSYGSYKVHRDNVLCPYDLTLERHRLMWLYLKNDSDFFTADHLKMMHIAPEQCFHKTFQKQANLDYTTGDLESPIADLHFDLHNVPLDDNTYDVIFCNHVLEHVEDDAQCMKELYRIMKPGGWGIFQVPIDYSREETFEDPSITDPLEREEKYWQKDHVRLYGKDYSMKLESAGFKVDVVDYKEKLGEELFHKYRLDPKELLYVCHKP